jgi:hypothetical protein
VAIRVKSNDKSFKKIHMKYESVCSLGCHELDLENEKPRPVMGAQLKSKTHFLFFEPFFACLASRFKKVLI